MEQKILEELHLCIDTAIKEDDAFRDITSLTCLLDAEPVEAKLFLKQKARISGLIFLPHIFQRFDPHIKVKLNSIDGEEYEEGTILAQIIGNPCSILPTERIALNLIAHLSGITDMTAKFVEEIKELSCDILDTRKTLPGLRHLQKYAVRMGGGKNHRLSLSDKILIKDNHLAILKDKQTLLKAISNARISYPGKHVEVEVSEVDLLDEAIEAKPDSILLDNMNTEDVREAVIRARNADHIYLEASGNIGLNNIKGYAITGVDGVSIGSLTHSVKAIDMSLKI